MARSYGVYRRYKLQSLVGQSAEGDEVLPDLRVIEQIWQDVQSASRAPVFHSETVVNAFNELLETPPEVFNRARLDMSLIERVFLVPMPEKSGLCQEYQVLGTSIPVPFAISPGAAYIEPKVDLDVRSLSPTDYGYELKMRPNITIPGLLVPKTSRLETLCDSLVDLTRTNPGDMPPDSMKAIKAYLSRSGVTLATRIDEEFMSELAFSVFVMAEELIGISTKSYANAAGEAMEYALTGDDEVGIY